MNKSQIPVAQKDVLSLLLDDHKEVKKLFKQFEAEKSQAAKEDIAREACMKLTVHATIEEELFYPFLRAQNPDAFGDLLNEALVEHGTAKELIAQIQATSIEDDDLYEAKVTVLSEYVAHHVKEEEDELFPKVIGKKVDLRELLTPVTERKEELLHSAVTA